MSNTYELDEAKNLIAAEELGEYLNEGSISTAASDGSIWITSNNSGSTGAILDIQSGDSSIEGPTKLSVSGGTLTSVNSTTQINESSLELNSTNIDLSNTQFGSFGTGSLYATKTFGFCFGYNYTSDQYFYNRTDTNIRFWTFKFNSTEATDLERQVVNAGSSLRMMKAITSDWDYFLVGWVLNNKFLD